jgi:hypothetical protein
MEESSAKLTSSSAAALESYEEAIVRVPAGLEFKLHRAAAYLGRRVGYALENPIR